MQKWLIPSNPTIYNSAAAFEKNGFIDWRQKNNKYEVGDIVYLYISRTHKKVMFKAVVEKVNIPSSEITDDKEFWVNLNEYYQSNESNYFRIRLLEKIDQKELSFEYLKQNGLNSTPQSPQRINSELAEYLDKYFNHNEFVDIIKHDYNIWSMNVLNESYGEVWDLFLEKSFVSMDIRIKYVDNDYTSLDNIDEIKSYLKDEKSRQPLFINNFVNKMKKGDIFIAHKGNTILSAVGIITGDYNYNPESTFKHIRSVK